MINPIKTRLRIRSILLFVNPLTTSFKGKLPLHTFTIAISAFLVMTSNTYLKAQLTGNNSIDRLRVEDVFQFINSHSDSVSVFSNLQGIKYNPNLIYETETPFFNNLKNSKGEIIFNHFRLGNLSLIYDINTDELVFITNFELIELRKEMVEKFNMVESDGVKHDFINLSFTINNDDLQNGYFEIIYRSDKSAIYVKHRKELESRMKPGGIIDYYYLNSNKYYLYHSNNYYNFKSLNSLIKQFEKFNEELKIFIKKQKFSKRKLIDKQLIEIMSYIDKLQ